MEKCIKCGRTLPADAKLCPYCGNPVSFYEEKMQPVPPASKKQTRSRTILIVAVAVLGGLLIASLAFALVLWTGSAAPPKLAVSPGSLDFGTLQVGSQSSQVLTLSNSGKQDLNWSADKGKADWLTLDLSQGSIPAGGSQTINVRADTTLLTAGRYSAVISFSSNGGGASVNAVLTVTSVPPSPSAPAVSSISPTSGPATGGTTVTIAGSGFTGASKVLFGTATSTFSVNSDTQITAVSPGGSGIVHVTVTTPGGTTMPSNADQFTYLGAPAPIPTIPTIASISPSSGPLAGGTTVTITGSGFTGASKVLFGTATSTFTVNSATQITAVSPGGSGTVDVTVTTPGGTSTTGNADRFTYMPVPTVTSISPTAGPVTGKTSVIIRGTGFTGATKVLFGTTAASFTLNSATQITAVSPAGSGTVDVKVTTPGGTSATSNADRFIYVPAPTIAGISPTSGPITGGTSVKITGSNFTGATKVLFGTVAASSFTVNSTTQITAVSPAGSGTVDVKVTTPGGTSATSAADRFTYVPVPTVTSISPTSGPVTGGTKVIITGTGFTGATKVLFGTVPASSFKVDSATQITAVSPAGSGTVDVKVITPGGTSAITAADRFTYMPAPTIASISPTSGPAAGGTSVIIRGTHFTGASKVLFGTVAASSVTVNSDTQITAVSPAGSGTVDVKVITPGGTSATSTADQFTYVPAPIVTGISPTSGPAAGGTPVTIVGSNFTGASKVLFGSTAASITAASDIQITVTSPAGSGTVDVRVITPGGTSATSTADRFTYVYAQPKITGISPTSGPATGGTTVTIAGSNFTGASQVLFGNVAASNLKVVSDTQITVTSPGGSGTVHVKVTTPGGTSATSTADQFTYVPAPTVTGISPTSGPAAGGTTVTITGTGFIGATKVLFGTAPASSVTVNSDIQITAVSPAGSGTVDVRVITPGGTSAITGADRFTYVFAQPKITSISPTSGPVTGGTTVTITGSNFTGASKVLFGTVAASNVKVVNDTTITAVSPASTTGPGPVDVTVTTPGGTSATSTADRFTYLKPAQIAVAPTSLDFGPMDPNTTNTLKVTVSNTGGQPLNWKVDTSSLPAWLTVDKSSDTIQANSSETINVTVNTTNLKPGPYSTPLNFTSNGGNVSVKVTLTVNTPPPPPVMGVSPNPLDLGSVTSGQPASGVETVSNTGGQPLDWKVDTGGTTWLSVDTDHGTVQPGSQQTITVTADTKILAAGDYSATLTFTSNGGSAQVTVTINVK